jgi:hypothetical protein
MSMGVMKELLWKFIMECNFQILHFFALCSVTDKNVFEIAVSQMVLET